MPNRKSLVSMLWLTSTLALLASALVGPMRTSGFVASSSRPDCLCRNFALPSGQPKARPSAAMAAAPVLRVYALPYENEAQDRANALDKALENEEQDWADALDEPRVTFLLPWSFRNVPDRQWIAPPSFTSLSPLRC